MSDAELAGRQTWRTFELLTREHLDRLADLAARDHEAFTRPAGRPEYRPRRLLAVLAQGAARHYLDCLAGHDPGSRTGVKDLDVWTFYAAIPGTAFPADARTAREQALWRRFAAYQGRRVDFLMRALPVRPGAPYAEIIQAVQDWLRRGAASSQLKKPSAWHLAQKAMVTLTPAPQRGQILWPADAGPPGRDF